MATGIWVHIGLGIILLKQQTITWTNVDFSLVRFCGIHLRTISQQVLRQLFIIKVWNKHFKLSTFYCHIPYTESLLCLITQLGSAGMSNIIRDAIAFRRKHRAPPGEHLLLDVLLENDFSDDIIFADALTYGMGGFHTTGFGMYLYFITLPRRIPWSWLRLFSW